MSARLNYTKVYKEDSVLAKTFKRPKGSIELDSRPAGERRSGKLLRKTGEEIENHVQSDHRSNDEIEYLRNKVERRETDWNELWNTMEQ